jgi:HlyD family secretion protein
VSLGDRTRQQLQVIRQDLRQSVRLRPARQRPRILLDAIPFQSDLDEIIEEPAPRLLRMMAILIGCLLLALAVVASMVRMDIVVVASGHLAADSPVIVLQPMERSIIRELRVRPGDVVRKGDLLATLDPTFSEAELDSLLVEDHTLTATIARLQAELAGGQATARSVASTDTEASLQETIYLERRRQYEARLQAFDEEIGHDEAALATTEEDNTQLARQLVIARNILAARTALLASQAGSKLQFYDAQALAMRAERDYLNSMNRSQELRHSLQARRADRQAFVSQWRSDLLEQLSHDRDAQAKVADAVAKASRMHDMVSIAAPSDGVILDVAMRSAGSVLREAEPLITEMPADAALIADVTIASEDIGYLKPGVPAVVKVSAFPFERHGMLPGSLRAIAQEPLGSEAATGISTPRSANGAGFHRAIVALASLQLSHLPPGARLIPGMTVTAELKVGSRSVISYFLDPIKQGLDDSFHEQ